MKFAQSSMVYFNYTLEYAIRELGLLGYDGIEIWGGRPHMYRHDLDKEIDALNEALDESGLTVCNFIPAQFRYPSLLCSLNEYVRRDSVAYIKTAMDNAIAIGAPSVSLCSGMLPWNQELPRGWENLRQSFREIHEYNKDKGLTMLIEPAHRFETNLILTIEDALRMITELDVDDFGVLLDAGHCHLNGEDFRTIIPACAEHLFHIHVDDNQGDMDAHLIPGDGTIDFNALSRNLKQVGYQGFVSVELGPKYIMEPRAACERSLQELTRLFW